MNAYEMPRLYYGHEQFDPELSVEPKSKLRQCPCGADKAPTLIKSTGPHAVTVWYYECQCGRRGAWATSIDKAGEAWNYAIERYENPDPGPMPEPKINPNASCPAGKTSACLHCVRISHCENYRWIQDIRAELVKARIELYQLKQTIKANENHGK